MALVSVILTVAHMTAVLGGSLVASASAAPSESWAASSRIGGIEVCALLHRPCYFGCFKAPEGCL